MKNIIIFGAGKLGMWIKKALNNIHYDVSYFCDNNAKKHGKLLDDVPIISFNKLVDMYSTGFNGDIIIAVGGAADDDIVTQLRENILYGGGAYVPTYKFIANAPYYKGSFDDMFCRIDYKKPKLRRLNYNLLYHCNLKCNNCSTGSNVPQKEFGDIEQYSHDLHRLKEMFWGISNISFAGGETFLSPQIIDFIMISRELFPEACIVVMSNGLLIPKADTKILEVMREASVTLHITQYRPTLAIREDVELVLIRHGVNYVISDLVDTFYEVHRSDYHANKEVAFSSCPFNTCVHVENGKMACFKPIVALRHPHLRDKYTQEQLDVFEKDCIDIYNDDLDGFKLNEILFHPYESCKYCPEQFDVIPWECVSR